MKRDPNRDLLEFAVDDEPEFSAGESNGQAESTHEPLANSIGPAGDLLLPNGLTDAANARRFKRLHEDATRWCDPFGKWLIWTGTHWAIDAERIVDAQAKRTAKEIWHQHAELVEAARNEKLTDVTRFAKYSSSARGISNMLTLAKSDLAILPASLDTDPWAFNCLNGTIDLRSGELRPHRRDDFLTKLCPVKYDPLAEAPHWEAMLAHLMLGATDMVSFLQRAVGYSMTGSVQEQCLFLCFGKGANGKSTFLNAILDVFGHGYSMQAADGLLMAKRNDSHPTERADLFGKRFISNIEVEEGRRINESLVKALTGGDVIRARRMREDHWEFKPTHKLWMAANHKPTIRGTDLGIWRRMRLVPFLVTIVEGQQDKELPQKLWAEREGILAWAVEGCLAWQRDGLDEPEAVRAATNEYRAEMDVLGAFIAERCIEASTCRSKASELYSAYSEWCRGTGEHAINQRRFGAAMTERGYERYVNNGKWYRGIGVTFTEPTE